MHQAFALTVVDFGGEKISKLASDLSAQGYAVTTVTVSEDDQAADAAPVEIASPVKLAEEPAAEAEVGSLAFKCPACGAEFDEQVECTNQHPAVQTLPTSDVLAGASPEGTPAGGTTAAEDTAGGADGAGSSSPADEAGDATPAAGSSDNPDGDPTQVGAGDEAEKPSWPS